LTSSISLQQLFLTVKNPLENIVYLFLFIQAFRLQQK
jgi:hypothetical protein